MQRIIRELRFTSFPSVVYTALGEVSHHHSVMDYVAQKFFEEHR